MLTDEKLTEFAKLINAADDKNMLKAPAREMFEQCGNMFAIAQSYIVKESEITQHRLMGQYSKGMNMAMSFITQHQGIFEMLRMMEEYLHSPHEDVDRERFVLMIDSHAENIAKAIQFLRQAFKEQAAQQKVTLQ